MILCIILNLFVWVLYLGWSSEVAFLEATESLRRTGNLILILGFGHILPLILLVIHLVLPFAEFSPVITVLAGLAIIVGVVNQKASIILKVGYLRGIELKWPKKSISYI